MKQNEAVRLALENLGGSATLEQLNYETLKIKDCVWKTKTPFASIRRIVQTDPKYIYKIKPGLYGLLAYEKQNEAKGLIQETAKNKDSKEVIELNHSYYQGVLVKVGNLKKLNTFVPNQDKNRIFLGQTLGELRTFNAVPKFSYDSTLQRSSTIDVIWFNERSMPHSLFEVEHSTDIQNSLLKFNDLQDFYTRMVVVADKARRTEYESKIKYSSFGALNTSKRVNFLDYDALIKQYEDLVEAEKFEFIL
ncbi:hypothetical protein GCM10027037_25360 [Mucilaginibacter koreensis]